MNEFFRIFSEKTAHLVGSAYAFIVAALIVVIWLITGPLFHFSDTWQLVINTGTTIITFLMVFLIQNTQNRDSKALHLKLDELIFASKKAKNKFIDSEELSDTEIEKNKKELVSGIKKRKLKQRK